MRPRPSTAALGLVVLVLLAGCAGIANSSDSTATPTPAPTAAQTAAASATPSGPANATDANTIAYADLGPEAKAAFADARASEARFLPNTSHVEGEFYDPDALDPYAAHEYVERNGTYYAVEITSGNVYAHYDVRAVLTDVDPSDATHIEDLPANASEFVRAAIENRSASTDIGESLPEGLDGVQYVQRNDEVYELRIAIGDYPAQRLSFERVG